MAKTVSSQQSQTDEARLLIKRLKKEIEDEKLVPISMSFRFYTTEVWDHANVLKTVTNGEADFEVDVISVEPHHHGWTDPSSALAALKKLNKTLKHLPNFCFTCSFSEIPDKIDGWNLAVYYYDRQQDWRRVG